ncbi:MAG: hypothetical protein K2Q14_00065 [Gammaproteobacteria bacterium]|nr:hypothetical protein [Gammaproteobacteria bacterium]
MYTELHDDGEKLTGKPILTAVGRLEEVRAMDGPNQLSKETTSQTQS